MSPPESPSERLAARLLPSRIPDASPRSVGRGPGCSEARIVFPSTQLALPDGGPAARARKQGDSSLYFEALGHPAVIAPGEVRYGVDSSRLQKTAGDRRPAAALAVQHDRDGRVELARPIGQRRQRDVNCSRKVSASPFVGSSHIDDLHLALSQDVVKLVGIQLGYLLGFPVARFPVV